MVQKIKYAAIALIVLMLSVVISPFAQADPIQTILSVKTTPDSSMETQLSIVNNDNYERITRTGARKAVEAVPVSDTYLTIKTNHLVSTFVLDKQGNLYDDHHKEMIEIPEQIKSELQTYMSTLRSLHYGKMVPWDTAKQYLPKKKICSVIDMETGLTFRVQRRAGKNHADVQPLTKEDTAIMKQIYNGTWSWQRKAILVETDGQLLAASMHGMPHGGDGIPDNGFSGHFCIHFSGSTTHGSSNIDPEHRLMIYKAAGKLEEYIDHASPYAVADAFLMAFHLREPQIIKMSFAHTNHPELAYFLHGKSPITAIRKRSTYVLQDITDALTVEIPVRVSVYRKGERTEKTTFTFRMRRASLVAPWKIHSVIPSASQAEQQ